MIKYTYLFSFCISFFNFVVKPRKELDFYLFLLGLLLFFLALMIPYYL